MIVTDWRQYKTTPGDYEDGGLKTLKGNLRLCQCPHDYPCDFNKLCTIKPLKPLKAQVEGEKSGICQNVAETWAERAAIKEFCGGIPREQAEEEAAMEYRLTDCLEELRKMGLKP